MSRILLRWWTGRASEFHTFANIQILNGRARLEHMSACLFDVDGENSENPREEKLVFDTFTIHC